MIMLAPFAIASLLRPLPVARAQDTTRTDSANALAPRLVISQPILRAAPIDDPRELLTLVPGIVRRGTAFGIGAGSGLAFQDGVRGRASVYIDGAPAQIWTNDGPGITLSADAIDQIAITTGIAPADVADAQGGVVIAYTTPSGGTRTVGHLLAHSDALFGSGSGVGYNRFAGSAGGPFSHRFSWFVSGEVIGQGSAYRGLGAGSVPSYAPNGVDTVAYGVAIPAFTQTTSLQRPFEWLTERRALGKLALRYGESSSLSLTGLLSDNQQRFSPGTDLADSALYAGERAASRLGIVSWVHALGPGASGPSLHAVVSFAYDEDAVGPLTAAAEHATRSPALGIDWTTLSFNGADSIPFPVTDRLIRNIRSYSGTLVPFQNRVDLRNEQIYRLNPYGAAIGWPTQGVDGILSLASDSRATARMWLAWRPATAHTATAGFDYERGTQTFYQADLLSTIDLDAWRIHPRRIGVYAEDHVSAHRLAVDLGIRYDHFTSGGLLPVTPGRIFSNPTWNPSAGVDDTAYAASLTRVMTASHSPSALSPRLGAVYAVSGRVAVRARFGQTVEAPTAAQLFAGSNSDLSFTFSQTPFGRDVPFLKSTQLDLGVSARVAGAVDVDVTVFHRTEAYYIHLLHAFDDPGNPGAKLLLNTLTPIDSVQANGFDVAVQLHRDPTLAGSLAYSLNHAAGVTTQSVAAIATLTSPPSWGAAVRDVSVTALLHAENGLPYQRLLNVGSGALAVDNFSLGGTVTGPGRLPWTKTLDLRVGKGVHAAGISGSIYVDVRNLLDLNNLINAFAETGATTNSLYESNILSQEYANLRIEASQNGALLSNNAVDLRPNCGTWTGTTTGSVDCVLLRRVERRFGNGDGVYDVNEQTRAFSAYYDAFVGTWAFAAPGRTARIGFELTF